MNESLCDLKLEILVSCCFNTRLLFPEHMWGAIGERGEDEKDLWEAHGPNLRPSDARGAKCTPSCEANAAPFLAFANCLRDIFF